MTVNEPLAKKIVSVMRDTLAAAEEGTVEWEWAFDAIFALCPLLMDASGKKLPDYCDPDTTYEEDVRAFMRSLDEIFPQQKEGNEHGTL